MRLRLRAWFVALVGSGCTAAAPQGEDVVSWTASGVDLDLKTEIITFENLELNQAGWTISADAAQTRGQDPEQGGWNLSGDVRLAGETLAVQAENARISVENGEVEEIRLTGAPVIAVHRTDERPARTLRGRAPVVEFLPGPGILRFEESAHVSAGRNEVSAKTIVYDLNAEIVHANGSDGRVEITMDPPRSASAE